MHKKIKEKTAKIGIIGLGYVGLPHAVHYADQGFSVTGIDHSAEKINALLSGKSYIEDITNEQAAAFASTQTVTNCWEAVKALDVLFIAVPTPIDEHLNPDLTALQAAMSSLLPHCRRGQLLILESTSYPTTTREQIVQPLLDQGFNVGEDIFVAFSPERIDPGNKLYTVDNTPKLIGGFSSRCTSLGKAIVGEQGVAVSSMEVAEMAKLYENTFRFVNIGLADELSKICHTLNIRTSEVLTAAATKPFGFMRFDPAPKIGGHCIAVDPYYLKWYMNNQELATPMLDAAGETDRSMSGFTCERVLKLLIKREVPSFQARVAIIGAAYKKNIADVRMSAAPALIEALSEFGITSTLYDPYVKSVKTGTKSYDCLPLNYQALQNYDMVIILTDHDIVDYDQVMKNAQAVFDTKAVKAEDYGQAYYTF